MSRKWRFLSDENSGKEEQVPLEQSAPNPDVQLPLIPKSDTEEQHRTLLLRSTLILSSEFCERLAYYSIVANLVLFLMNNLGIEKGLSNSLVLAFSGTCYMTPLLGGWIADTLLGRFWTIIVFLVVYIIGMTIFAIGAIPGVDSTNPWVAFMGLLIIAFGTGGLKSNVITFGADQFIGAFDDLEKQEKGKETFFRWFYFCINLGSFFSYTVIGYVQQNISFPIGLGVAAAVMAISGISFVLGSKMYTKNPPGGSIVQKGITMVYHCLTAPPDVKRTSPSFLDRALHIEKSGEDFTATDVKQMKLFARLIPILLPFIVFGTLYSQMSSAFFTQGTVLRLDIGLFEIPISSLHVFNTVGVLVLIPFIDRVVFPFFDYFSISISILKRIACGFLLVTAGMMYAGGLEVYRLRLYSEGHVITQVIGGANVTAADLNVLVQAPAYFIIAAGEVFAMTTGLEFMYSQSPPNMRSMVVAIFYLTQSLGSYLGALIVAIVNDISAPNKWIGEDLNTSHMDNYFFLLAILGLINFFIFLPYTDIFKTATYEEIHGTEYSSE